MRLQLRQPWRVGTTDVVFDPVEFLGRLAVLVPTTAHQLDFVPLRAGEPRAAYRAEVVRRQPSGEGGDGLGRSHNRRVMGGQSALWRGPAADWGRGPIAGIPSTCDARDVSRSDRYSRSNRVLRQPRT